MGLSQTGAIVALGDWLKSNGWDVVYRDLPNASRSGFGLQGSIAVLFEHVLDRTPDIVAIRSNDVLVAEVDRQFAMAAEKMVEYRKKQAQILQGIADLYVQSTNWIKPSGLNMLLCFSYFPKDRSDNEMNLIGSYKSTVDTFLCVTDTKTGTIVQQVVI